MIGNCARAEEILKIDQWCFGKPALYAEYFEYTADREQQLTEAEYLIFHQAKKAYGLARQAYLAGKEYNQLSADDEDYVSMEELDNRAAAFIAEVDAYYSVKLSLNFTYCSVEEFHRAKVIIPEVQAFRNTFSHSNEIKRTV